MSQAEGDTMPAQAPDRDEIVRVVQLYIDGVNDGDIEKFREAFHPDARITFTDRDGELASYLIYDCIDDWSSDPGDDIRGRIISVTQAGDVASVLLGFDYKPDLAEGWVDIHSLLKLDGTWKIMNKTATHVSRAAWAAPPAPTPA
jgi:Putative lumazine-binding